MVLIAIAAFFFMVGYLGEHETRAFLKTAKPATGRVIGHAIDVDRGDMDKRQRTDTYSYRPRIAFKTLDGVEHTCEGRNPSSQPLPPVDTLLDVLYNPANPNNARINTVSELYYSARGMNLAALVAFVLALFLLVIDRLDALFGLSKSKSRNLSGDDAGRTRLGERD